MSTTKTCFWRDRVMLVASGEEPETTDVRDHLAECDACRQLYADLGRISALSLPKVEVPKETHRQILAAVQAEAADRKHVQRSGLSWLGWIFDTVPKLAWATIFLAVVSVGVWQYEQPQTSEEPEAISAEELDYGLAVVEMQLDALESEIEMSLMDVG